MLRNPGLRRELLFDGLCTLLFAAVGLFLSPLCALLILGAGICVSLLHVLFARRRYRAIAALSESIDRILHGQEQLLIADSEEGELSILRSEIRKMTVRLKESADLLQADKLRLSDAMADISHQLRTPLTAMNLTLSLLAKESLPEERRLPLTYELRQALEKIDWLVEILLKMSGIDAGAIVFTPAEHSVAEWVRCAADPLVIPMELREQTLSVQVGEECFRGDLRWCGEALQNILKNCVEHTPMGGEIRISARETALFVELTVVDNGEGFNEEDLPHLFERFYRGRNAAAGSAGIGLAFARTVLEAQGAILRAENQLTGGARFILRFPKGIV